VGSDEELSSDEEGPNNWLSVVGGRRRDEKRSSNGSSNTTVEEHSNDWEIIKAPYSKLLQRLRRDTQGSSESEVVCADEVHKHGTISLELELPLPDLVGMTEVLEEPHRKQLIKHLPARAEGYAWSLIFSSAQHGFSLQTLYRRMAKFESPVLLVIMDTENNVFGALTSCSLRVSEHFYGTGESFLFTFYPEFKIFTWTGENLYFIKGNNESLAIGSGDGFFGLWLDGDLYHGRSQPCKTYDNDMLTNKEDFHVKTLEAWGFIEPLYLEDSTC
jgi:hypothetical protein